MSDTAAMPEQPERDPAPGVPTDPAEQEAWKRQFTDDLMAGEPGGIGITWHDGRPQR